MLSLIFVPEVRLSKTYTGPKLSAYRQQPGEESWFQDRSLEDRC